MCSLIIIKYQYDLHTVTIFRHLVWESHLVIKQFNGIENEVTGQIVHRRSSVTGKIHAKKDSCTL